MKKYLILFLVMALAVFMLFIGISCNNSAAQAEEKEETAIAAPVEEESTEAEVKPGTEHEVIIENFAFDSSDLIIKAGDTVTWTQNDGTPHTVRMDAFESDKLSKGDTFSFTFDDAGTYEYICGIHPTMQGKIIVE